MTLLEKFKKELETETIMTAFENVNTFAVYDSLTNKDFNILDVFDFVEYFIKNYKEKVSEILGESKEAPFVFYLHGIIKSVQKDVKFLAVLDNMIDNRMKYELITLKKEIEKIVERYGISNIGKIGFIKINDQMMNISNDIYVENKDQIDAKLLTNFLTVALQLDYCFINILTYDRQMNENIMISYQIKNHMWKEVDEDVIEEALDNINYEEYFGNKVLVKSLKRKYWKK